MKLYFCSIASLAIVAAFCTSPAIANLLDDGGFELSDGNSQTSNSAWQLNVNFPDGTGSAAQFQDAPWASNPLGVAGKGVWFKAFEGEQATGDAKAEAELRQLVSAGPGTYNLSFYVRHETNFTADAAWVEISSDAGGLTTFNLLTTPNDGNYNQYSIDGFVAPAGTSQLLVRAVMDGGRVNPANPQSLMVDDFDLVQVPEPGSTTLGVLALLGLITIRRK
ncbi:MAG: hypothetical protein KDA60_19610 [Planctomycetales bacterium]|nr:hypothetical protein [Planctomycetales bacterium]